MSETSSVVRVDLSRVLALAIPMVVSMGAFSLTQFTNRLFLSWYSKEAIAAAVPASGLTHALFCVFLGTALYTSSFVAQDAGAGRDDRIGGVLWAGLWVALVGQIVMVGASFFADDVFAWLDHPAAIRQMEADYFRVSCFGMGAAAAAGVLSSFYSGRGSTRPVMWVGSSMAVLNVALDYALIFGEFGLPRMGMLGAAVASVIGQWLGFFIWVGLVFRPRHEARYRVWASRGWNAPLLRRLVRFGLPSGMHFFLDGAAWAAFSLLVGQLGVTELAASNIAWQIHSLVLLPIFGVGGATTILVGQCQGAGRTDLARRAMWTSLGLGLAYLLVFAAFLLLGGEWVVRPFLGDASGDDVLVRVRALLPYVALLGLAHTTQMIVVSALKGAGDVRFIMIALALSSTFGFIAPLAAFVRAGFGLETLWLWFAVSSGVMALVFAVRFRGDGWSRIRLLGGTSTASDSTS